MMQANLDIAKEYNSYQLLSLLTKQINTTSSVLLLCNGPYAKAVIRDFVDEAFEQSFECFKYSFSSFSTVLSIPRMFVLRARYLVDGWEDQ